MAKRQTHQPPNIGRIINKFLLSSFVVFSFIVYVINQRITKPDSPLNSSATSQQVLASSQSTSTFPIQPTLADPNNAPLQLDTSGSTIPTATALPTLIPTMQPSATTPVGLYKDGSYTGPQVDAYYGIVEVQVKVQNGMIADVKFLQYPSDRRTSQRINAIAMPYLQQEALQAQSANVNIISGATFTSEGFAMSLNAALKSAKN